MKSTDIGGYVTEEASKLTGLKKDTPVAVGSGDGITTILGLGIYKDGDTGITVGSAGVIGAASTKFPEDKKNRSYIFCHPNSDRWYSIMATASSGEVFRWYKNSIINGSVSYHDLDMEAKITPSGAGSLIFFPYLLGSRNPHCNPEACGMIMGLRHKHNRGYLTRAILEGVSLELLEILSVQKEILVGNNLKISKIKLSGGIINSHFWVQLFADVLQHELITTRATELGTFGSAVIATVAAGIYKDLETAIESMVSDDKVIQFDTKKTEIYKKKYLIFKEVYKIFEPKFNLFSD